MQPVNNNVEECFNNYKESIFSIDHDIRFWKHFLKISIDSYPSEIDREISTAIFTVYDHPFDRLGGFLKRHQKVYRTNVSELHKKSTDFITWIMNLALLNAYNSMEILLLQAIQIKYYPNSENPILGRKQADKIHEQIKQVLRKNSIKVSTKNNDHVIKFLRLKSSKINVFLDLKMNTDLNSRWIDFFNLISILRNIVAHCAMIVQVDIQNEIKSKAKDIFERHFEIVENHTGFPILTPKSDIFNGMINRLNTLTTNLYKFNFDETDLKFLGLN